MKYATRMRLARRIALQRLSVTAREDADNCDDEALVHGSALEESDAALVREALNSYSIQFDERARKIVP